MSNENENIDVSVNVIVQIWWCGLVYCSGLCAIVLLYGMVLYGMVASVCHALGTAGALEEPRDQPRRVMLRKFLVKDRLASSSPEALEWMFFPSTGKSRGDRIS